MDWAAVLLEPGLSYRTVGSLALPTFETEEALLDHLDVVKPKGELDLAPSPYYRRHWMPDVGPAWNSLISNLRDLALYDPLPQASATRLADAIGVSPSTIHNMLAFRRYGLAHFTRDPRTWSRKQFGEWKRWFGVRLYIPELLNSQGRPNAYLVTGGDHKHIRHRPDLWPYLPLQQPAWLFGDEWDEEKQSIFERFGPVSIYAVAGNPSRIWSGQTPTPPKSGGVMQPPLQNLEGWEGPESASPGTTPPKSGGVPRGYLATATAKEAAEVPDRDSEPESARSIDLRRRATAALLEIEAPNPAIEELTATPEVAQLALIWATQIGPTKPWWKSGKWKNQQAWFWVRSAVRGCKNPASLWAGELREFTAAATEPPKPPAQRSVAVRRQSAGVVIDIEPEMVPYWEIAGGVIPSAEWETWCRDCAPCGFLNLVLFIHAPNTTTVQWLSRRWGKALAEALRSAFPHVVNETRFVLPGECDVCRKQT